METISSPGLMQNAALARKGEGKLIAFVPTMGYLHQGHLSLIRAARKAGDVLAVSIFVNPSQFGPTEDLGAYPRDLQRDLGLLQDEGVDLVFTPGEKDIYPDGYSTWVEEERFSRPLCGAARPGHFRGVATVVLKLFNLVQPDTAFFGQKDYQQALVISKMVEDLNLPVTIEVCPIVREKDGLALSSRNKYLSPEERAQAPCLFAALNLAEKMTAAGELDTSRLIQAMRGLIESEPDARIDYVSILEAENLEPIETIKGPAVAALAVFIGTTRLIDNAILSPPA